MRRIFFIILILGLLIALVGCSHADSALPLTQATSGISAALMMEPYPPTQMKEANLRLTLQDQDNQPVTGARVQFDLSKLDLSMPPYFLGAFDDGNGIYQASGTFTMSGDWQIRVDVFVEGTHRQFTYLLKVE
jgi:hypothetical protein